MLTVRQKNNNEIEFYSRQQIKFAIGKADSKHLSSVVGNFTCQGILKAVCYE